MTGCWNLSTRLVTIRLGSFLLDPVDDFGQIDIIYFSQIHKSTTFRFDGKLQLYDRSDPDSVSHQLFLSEAMKGHYELYKFEICYHIRIT